MCVLVVSVVWDCFEVKNSYSCEMSLVNPLVSGEVKEGLILSSTCECGLSGLRTALMISYMCDLGVNFE